MHNQTHEECNRRKAHARFISENSRVSALIKSMSRLLSSDWREDSPKDTGGQSELRRNGGTGYQKMMSQEEFGTDDIQAIRISIMWGVENNSTPDEGCFR